MSPITELIQSLVPYIPLQQQPDEEYLRQPVDACGVECRLAEFDHRSTHRLSQAYPLSGALQ